MRETWLEAEFHRPCAGLPSGSTLTKLQLATRPLIQSRRRARVPVNATSEAITTWLRSGVAATKWTLAAECVPGAVFASVTSGR